MRGGCDGVFIADGVCGVWADGGDDGRLGDDGVGDDGCALPQAELDAKIDWLIGRIADKSPTAIRRGKYAMRAIASMSFDEAIAYTETQIALLAMTEDAKESHAAWRERRRPKVRGA